MTVLMTVSMIVLITMPMTGLMTVPKTVLMLRQALGSVSVADNHLQSLPSGMSSMLSLKQLWAYGNHLQSLPPDIVDLPAIKSRLSALSLLVFSCGVLSVQDVLPSQLCPVICLVLYCLVGQAQRPRACVPLS